MSTRAVTIVVVSPSRDKVNAGLKLKLIGCLQTSDNEDVGSA